MSINQETEEEEEESENIFPLLNRRTPIIDRIKNRRSQFNGTDDGSLSYQIARSALTGEPVDENFLTNLRADIAEELDIPENQINGMFLSRVRDTLSPTLEELVSQSDFDQSETNNQSQDTEETQEQTEEIEEEIEEDVDEESEESNNEESDDSTPAFPDEEDSDAEEIF